MLGSLGCLLLCHLLTLSSASPFLRGAQRGDLKKLEDAITTTPQRHMRRLRSAPLRLHMGVARSPGRLLGSTESATRPQPTCIDDRRSLPDAWRISDLELRNEIQNLRHADNSTTTAEDAARGAFYELVEFIQKPGMLDQLGTDAVEAIINGAFAGANMPDVRETALNLGQELFLQLTQQQLETTVPTCAELQDSDLPRLVQYGQYVQDQLPENATMQRIQTALEADTNEALKSCASLSDYLGFDPAVRLSKYPGSVQEASNQSEWIDPVYSMVLQAVDTLALLGNERLRMPDGALDYVSSFWAYLFKYPFPNAGDYAYGLDDPAFEQNSYIVTHLAYVVTGYQRYALQESDAPWLFSYLRENFYPAMASGHLDLYSEFLDNFRQYGCTSANDVQTQDGTLMLLKRYKQAGGQWLQYRDPDDDVDLSDYAIMHKAWTAYVGLHNRVFEAAPAGVSYFEAADEAVRLALLKAGAQPSTSSNASSQY